MSNSWHLNHALWVCISWIHCRLYDSSSTFSSRRKAQTSLFLQDLDQQKACWKMYKSYFWSTVWKQNGSNFIDQGFNLVPSHTSPDFIRKLNNRSFPAIRLREQTCPLVKVWMCTSVNISQRCSFPRARKIAAAHLFLVFWPSKARNFCETAHSPPEDHISGTLEHWRKAEIFSKGSFMLFV